MIITKYQVDGNGIYLIFIIFITLLITVNSLNDKPLLLLISMDGFRYDLLNAATVPNIWNFATKGVYFKNGCRPQYLTFTAPNHASIATGLLVESHGIVANYFYDPATNTTFDLFNSTQKEGIVNASLVGHFYNGEPIWLTNERGGYGRRSASLFWPTGSGHWPPAPHKPTLYRPWMEYKNLSQWMNDFDKIMELFIRQKDPYNFVAWYIPEPDHTLHLNGFKNGKINEKLRELDLLIKYVNDKLENNSDLSKRLNIILTSDHGHAEIEGASNVLCLTEVINIEGLLFGDRMMYVKDVKRKHQIYEALKKAIKDGHYGIKIYYKEDVPEEYGYSKNNKIGDILFEPEPGYNVRVKCSHDVKDSLPFHFACHGMNPNHWTMKSILLMKGPVFKRNYQVDTTANNIDLYPLMCYILGVIPAPNNGTLEHMLNVLKMSSAISSSSLSTKGIEVINS
ncbi:type I phosphodiesterase / nucleotide pyrophosphatase [Onchocerca flexuosa]|uniref:Type I phosphodiesterase / nucleotide pyrophosphatase n=2 Tax=Onchocerca flexuosa TaxID=387005 RepID=A0A238BZ11_9BILA|nr:type I phosphodiesterase / nucleotide pyrophosphatase [Onchocerca flexuosa]